jgi:arginase family enzyme
VRWRPDPQQRRPHNLQAVLDVHGEASRRVGEILADGRVPLVLGGECSVTIAVMAALRARGLEPALLYMDGGVDLFTPATNPTGILDSMGVAHLLDEPGDRRRPGRSRPGPAPASRRPAAAVRLPRWSMGWSARSPGDALAGDPSGRVGGASLP